MKKYDLVEIFGGHDCKDGRVRLFVKDGHLIDVNIKDIKLTKKKDVVALRKGKYFKQ